MKRLAWRRLASALLTVSLAGCAVGPAARSMLRDTTAGPVIGSDDGAMSGTWNWKGIPYARPPVADLRWRAPLDPQATCDRHVGFGTRQGEVQLAGRQRSRQVRLTVEDHRQEWGPKSCALERGVYRQFR